MSYNEQINNISQYITGISYLSGEKERLMELNINDIQKEISFVLTDLDRKSVDIEFKITRDFKSVEEKIGKIMK